MRRLEQILTKAMEMRAREVWMGPGQIARMRVGHDWKDMGGEFWSAQETKELATHSLSETDRRELFEKGFWSGSFAVMGRPLQMRLQLTEQGVAGSFQWRGSDAFDLEAWNLPAHAFDVLTRTKGITLVVGPHASGKSSLLFLLTQKLAKLSDRLVHFYSDREGIETPERVSSLLLPQLQWASKSSADILVVDGALTSHWCSLLELAESGRHVVASMTAVDLLTGLEKWRLFFDRQGLRGLDCLQMGIGTHLLSGLDSLLVPAAELLLVKQKMKDAMATGQWNLVQDEMSASGEKTGMRTLNQTLLQLLLRRKIEMRTAFQESQNPDEFDLLLKKVGI